MPALTHYVCVPRYYNALVQGDVDTLRSFLDFYLRMLPYVNARTKAQFKGLPDAPQLTGIAALYEETCTQFGSYLPENWAGVYNSSMNPIFRGCVYNSNHIRAHGASMNPYIRFHWTGSLELSLMVLDLYDHTGDRADLDKYLPITFGVVEGFRQRFPKKDAHNKTDMWPAQALETYQCIDPTNRSTCPSNPTTDVAGLMAVLPRLIALPVLPECPVTTAQRAAWQAQLAALPPLAMVPANGTWAHEKVAAFSTRKVAAIATGDGFPTSGKGKQFNSENAAMYVAHPFRIFGAGKPTDISVAQQAYVERPDPCNDGWCQDVIQAAMLNFTDEAAAQVAARAAATDHSGFRFEGFAGAYQDYMPSLDHYGFMRTGLDYMLLSKPDDAKGSILLFPAFPTGRWNVRFKLHAPRNTTVEASCQGGKLEYLIVTPPERKADVTVLKCLKSDDLSAAINVAPAPAHPLWILLNTNLRPFDLPPTQPPPAKTDDDELRTSSDRVFSPFKSTTVDSGQLLNSDRFLHKENGRCSG